MIRFTMAALLFGGALMIVASAADRSRTADAAEAASPVRPDGQVKPVSPPTGKSKSRRAKSTTSAPTRVPKHLRRVKRELYLKKTFPNRTQQTLQTKQRRADAEAATAAMNDNLKRTGTLSGNHHPEIDRALRKARSQKKLLFVIFTSQQAKICRKMDTECLGTDYVKKYMKDRYVVHVVDVDRKPGIADHYMFTPLIPHYKVLDADGTILKETTGYHGTTRFLNFLDR